MNEWEQNNPFAQDAAPSTAAAGDSLDWKDIGKGSVGGLGRGTTGLLGLPGDVANLMARGGEWIGDKLGLPPLPEDVRRANERSRPFSSADIKAPIENVTGPFYEPHTVPGQYMSTLGEFAPAAVIPGAGVGVTARALNTVIPALASETAGQITKGTEVEPWARAGTGVLGGVAGGKVFTPVPPATRVRLNAAAVLDREGIPITAGERTGSQRLKLLEETAGEMPFSAGAWQRLKQQQAEALNRRVTERTFDPAELEKRGIPAEQAHLPHADVFAQGKQSLKDEYNRLSQSNHLRSDVPLINDLQAVQANYERNVLPTQRATGKQNIEAIFHDIADNLSVNGTMPGDVYQAIRSRLGDQAQTAFKSDPQLGRALKGTQAALDRAIRRNMTPEDAAAWDLTNQRYANMKQLVPAVAKGGEFMTPAGIAQAVRSGRAEQAAAGAGNLDELANAANLLIKPLPNSMTAARTQMHNLYNWPNAISAALAGGGYGAGSLMGGVFGPLGAALGAAAPHIAGHLALSRAGQRYLGNQVAPISTRDMIAQQLAQQAISQQE